MTYQYSPTNTVHEMAHAGESGRLASVRTKIDSLGAELESLSDILPRQDLQNLDTRLTDLAARIADCLKGVT